MKALVFIFCVVLVFVACKKDTAMPYASQGTLLGIDHGYCPNCGGVEISIKNDTTKNAPAFYRISSNSTPLNLGSKPQFPINVSLDWKHDTAVYGGGFITVTRIKVIN